MFERFSPSAREALITAEQEARALNHNQLGTEHLLIGLARARDSIAGRALTNLGVTAAAVRSHVRRIVGIGQDEVRGHIPLTPRATDALRYAGQAVDEAGSGPVECEHILLGLVRQNEGVAARILMDFVLDPDTIRHEIRRLQGADPPAPDPPRPSQP